MKEFENMKQVQTAFSTTDVDPMKCKISKRSHSDEELGDNSRRYKRKELKEEILEWIDVYNEKLKVKLLREKMQKLAEKIKKPGEEEKLRKKIEKYLMRVPSQPDCGEDRIEFKRQLPYNIIRRLKKIYTKSDESNFTRMESLKIYSNIKRAVMDWLVTIPVKRQEFLGKTVSKDDIFNYLTGKLKSVVIDRPNSDVEYKKVLKSSITNIMESLPILCDNRIKSCKLADDLANDILNISTTFPNRYVQPTVRELKVFIADEISYLIEKSNININTKRMKYLEAELTDVLTGVSNTDDIVTDDVINIFRDIGKLPVYEAKLMTDIIINDYKTYFFRNDRNSVEKIPSRVCSVHQNATGIPIYNEKSCIDQLIDEIYDWFHDLPEDLCITKENLNEQLVNDLAQKIIRGVSIGEADFIDTEVDIWTKKVFKGRLNKDIEEQLKYRLRNVLHEEFKVEEDPKHERLVIRRYEDIIDEWLDQALAETRKATSFFKIRNERIHDLAIRLYNLMLFLNKSSEMITRKLQDVILGWMKTLPVDLVNKQINTDTFAAKLAENIEACDIYGMKEPEAVAKFETSQLENFLIDWLKQLQLYKNKSFKNKEIMELIMTKLADKLYNFTKDGNLDPNVEIVQYVRMLDTNQNDEFVLNTAMKLKQYLQKLNIFENLGKHINPEDEFLVANINIWLKYLPFDVKLVKNFASRKMEFVEELKSLKLLGASDDVQRETIIRFIRSLPLTHNTYQFLTDEANKLLHNLHISNGDASTQPTHKHNEIIRCTVKDWCKTLPLTSEYNPRELQHFIDNVTAQISKLTNIINPEYSFTNGNLHREIIKHLMKLPLEHTYTSHTEILHMANDLIEMLNEIRHRPKINVAMYGFSIKNNNTAGIDNSIQSINDGDIKSNLDNYSKQLVGQINEWLHDLQVPDYKEQSFKEVVINDLAADIIDRHKYLELNPASRGTNEEELEVLKYQIFKWINKLVGEDNLVTIEHASDLMNRIQGVPVPMLVKTHGKILPSPNESVKSRSLNNSQKPVDVNQPHKIGSGISSGSLEEQRQTSRQLSSKGDLGLASAPKSVSKSSQNEVLRQSISNPDEPRIKSVKTVSQNQANTLPKVYDKYQKIFIEKSNEIVNAAIPDDKSLAEMAKTGIYKGILNSIFTLKSNPDIENDYACFEFMMEDKVDELIHLLPHTAELDKMKHNWKISILLAAVNMLNQIHSVTDRPNFRRQLTKRLNRKALKDLEDRECFGLQQGFLVEMANDYILETNYKQDDPIKSNIYKQRLMKKLDDFANHISKEHKLSFKYINRVALKQLAMKVLDEVPIPAHDILQEEVEEILLAEEIEQWYKELPTHPYLNDMDVLLRKRLIEILAKKLNEIDKCMPREDPSKERLMKHEMTMFLERKGRLQLDQDLNINFMVDELNNRLKNRWVDKPVDYEAFDKDKPVSSTFARFENDDILPPVEAARDSDTAYTQSVEMPNDYRTYTPSNGAENGFPSCCQSHQSSRAYTPNMVQNPANINLISPHTGGYSSNLDARGGANSYAVNQGNQTYTKQRKNGDRNVYDGTYDVKGYTSKRIDMPVEEEDEEDDFRIRMRCKCNVRRSYVCYDCDEDFHKYVPCRYYF